MKVCIVAVGILLAGTPAAIAQDDEAEIRALIEGKYEKQNACDSSYAENYVTSDATELLPNDLIPRPKDPPESIAEFQAMCEAGGSSHNEVEFHSIDLITDDVALVIGHGHLRVLDPDGVPEIDGRYNFSEVFVRTDDGWRVRHLHVAPIFPDTPMENPGE